MIEPRIYPGNRQLATVADGRYGEGLPGEMLIHAGPIGAKCDGEEQLLDRRAGDGQTRKGLQVPYSSNIAGRGPFEPDEKDHVIGQEQEAADPGLVDQVGAAQRGSDSPNRQGDDSGIDRVPRKNVENRKGEEWCGERPDMKALDQTSRTLGLGNHDRRARTPNELLLTLAMLDHVIASSRFSKDLVRH